MKRYIGIDLGGTNIKAALADECGRILRQCVRPTHAEAGADAVTEAMAAMITELSRGEAVQGVGIGCPGTVDDSAGTVVFACNLGWVNYPLRDALKKRTGYTVHLVNDANAAALAEATVGAAKGAQSAIIITLGTGIGGGVVLEGKLLTGFTGAASEPGHTVLVADGAPCTCGRRGCWEAYASATALIRMTKAAMAQHPDSALHKIAAKSGGVDGRTAFLAHSVGDAAASAVVEEYIHYLSMGIANLANIFFPEVIALSGGIANQGEALLAPLRREVARQEYAGAYTKIHPQILQCALGNDAGIIGAALFAGQAAKNKETE